MWNFSLFHLSPVHLHVDPTWTCYALVKTPTLGMIIFYGKWLRVTKGRNSFTMTSLVSLKMTSPSPQLKGFMFTAYTLTEPAGIAGAVSLWNPLKRFSSMPIYAHLCPSFIFTQSTPPLDEIPGCTSARFTRNLGEQIWRTLQRLIWKPTRTQITGFFAGWLCCVISSKPIVSYTE